jgi:hypothetical protein
VFLLRRFERGDTTASVLDASVLHCFRSLRAIETKLVRQEPSVASSSLRSTLKDTAAMPHTAFCAQLETAEARNTQHSGCSCVVLTKQNVAK